MKLISIAKNYFVQVPTREEVKEAISEAQEFEKIVEWASEEFCREVIREPGLGRLPTTHQCGLCPPCRARKLMGGGK